jgi:hypothetical protein
MIILWHDAWKPEWFIARQCSVNTFPWRRIYAVTDELFEIVISRRFAPSCERLIRERGDEKGSLKFETVIYGLEYQGTRTREGLRWQGPAAYTKDRPFLWSERVPIKKQDRNCQTIIKIWSQAPDGCFMLRQTGRLTVGRNIDSDSEFNYLIFVRELSDQLWRVNQLTPEAEEVTDS